MEQETHDFGSPAKRCWGHDYEISKIHDRGMKISLYGWCRGITVGDFLILQNGENSTRYKVESIRYANNPSDMWFAEVVFAPRTEEN